MSFSFYLYRAAEGLGPWSTWSEMHAQPLGTRRELQARIESVFPAQKWELSPQRAWACYAFDDARLPREVSLMGTEDEVLRYVITYSAPPAIRTLMTALGLNHCYAPESDEIRHPFAVRDTWN
jgi:hypothetical protein